MNEPSPGPMAGLPIESVAGSEAVNVAQEDLLGGVHQSSRQGPRRAVRIGNEREVIAGVSDDESGGFSTNDASLAADVPPHWGRG